MAFKLKYNTTNFPFKKEVDFLDDKTNPDTKEEGKKMMRTTGELRKTEELKDDTKQLAVGKESDYLDKREEYEYVPQSVRDKEKGKPVGDDSIEKGKEESKGDVDKTKTEKSEASRQSQNQDQMTDDNTLEVGGRRKRKRDIEEGGYGV
tara:strand:+ start:125 stop:571 length:447 start_codon:yes stop_codon:yes gene_type:complete